MPSSDFRSILEAEAGQVGLNLSAECFDRLEAHYRLLVKWNRAVRLIGHTDPATVVRRHILESLALLAFLHEPRGSLLDIGSGNGFPAIPVKCALPDLRLGLIEPTVRKSVFLQTVVAELGLSDTRVFRDRIDRPRDLARFGRWEQITMRAVAAIPAVLAGAAEALRPRGRILFLVGETGRQEVLRRFRDPLSLAAQHRLPGTLGSYIVAVALTGSDRSETVH